MKEISIKECRKCGRQFYITELNTTLREGDEISIILLTFVCQDCKGKNKDPRKP